MDKQHVYTVTSVELSLIKKLPPDLIIEAKGETRSNGWTEPELQPRITIGPPPADGVYDFDFVAQPPQGGSNPVITPIAATYVWENLPDDVRGIRVHSETGCKTAWLSRCESCHLIDFEDAGVVTEVGGQFLYVAGEKPYLDMKVLLVVVHEPGPLPEYTRFEVVGCNGHLTAIGPYYETLNLAGVVGTKGIEVVGASRSQKIDVSSEARQIGAKAGARAA
jgi:hypothetical protein